MVVSGKVQGVCFRNNTRKKALQLTIAGWVKNNTNGTVELEATGAEENIEQLIKWLHRGPLLARVEQVKVTRCDLKTFAGFSIN